MKIKKRKIVCLFQSGLPYTGLKIIQQQQQQLLSNNFAISEFLCFETFQGFLTIETLFETRNRPKSAKNSLFKLIAF
jgi:hypothetical protein